MTRVLIIGGNGFVGNYFKELFAKYEDIEIAIGTRSPKRDNDVLITWNNPKKFYKNILSFDFIINASKWPKDKTLIKNIFELILNEGGIWLETTADYDNIEYLFDLQASSELASASKGSVLHGVGVFPGLSNLLINFFYLDHQDSKKINLGIRYNLFSGAGKAMCEMMSNSLTNPSLYISHGIIVQDKPVGKKIIMNWKRGKIAGNRVALCDIKYINRIVNINEANTVLSFKPSWITSIAGVFNYIPKVIFTQKILFYAFYALRGCLLSNVPTKMEIMVSDGMENYRLLLDDAFISGAESILGIIRYINERNYDIKRGLFCFDEIYSLEEFLKYKKKMNTNNSIIFQKY
ncbi:hypothetical protein [Galbibacter sp. BG1]